MSVAKLLVVGPWLSLVACGLGTGQVALRGATAKTYGGASDRDLCRAAARERGMEYATDCSGESDEHESTTFSPDALHFGVLLGAKRGYASSSYTLAQPPVPAPTAPPSEDASASTFELYFSANVGWPRLGFAAELGYAGQTLDGDRERSYGSWPLSLLAMTSLGNLTVFGGASYLTAAHLANGGDETSMSGWRLLGGLKGRAFSLWSGQIDVYPRVELQATRASGDRSSAYSSLGLAGTLECGF